MWKEVELRGFLFSLALDFADLIYLAFKNTGFYVLRPVCCLYRLLGANYLARCLNINRKPVKYN